MPEVTIRNIEANTAFLQEKKFSMPSIVGWNRLEPRPRSVDFERSLKAEVRDALWMLTRQWQMGEFKGEDAGSPINAQLLTGENTMNRFSAQGGLANALDNDVPLEARVERELIPDTLQLKIQVSTQFFALLKLQSFSTDHTTKCKTQYKISLPADTEQQNQILCNQVSTQLYDQASIRSLDGVTLLADILSDSFDSWINSYPDADIPAADKTILIAVGQTLLAWYGRLYNQPGLTDETTWSTPYLEYQFACSAPATAASQTIFSSEQYASGHLDWYAFDIDTTAEKLTDNPEATITDTPENEKLISFIPSAISFGGMPNARYWEMEDRKTDFGDIDANTTDLAKLIIAEFGLIYSNDWFILPYAMETGNICEIKGMIITDTFGDRTLINAAGKGADDEWQTWRLFNLSKADGTGDADNRLLLMPAVKVMESEPLEKINLIRDEMANMVWGVENTIILPSGKAGSGYEAAKELSSYLSDGYTALSVNLAAAVKYTLGTGVPENWIPFISVHVAGSDRDTQEQRAAMPRTSDGTDTLILPRTDILKGADPFYIHEEEIPRSGTLVTKTFQRTRWYNGKVVLWLGKQIGNGKGEGNSGLQFDQIENINTGG